MRARILCAIVFCACGATPPPADKPQASESARPPGAPIPEEVTKLAERWQMCWHFAGEEPYDAERSKQIADGEHEWCPGNEVERDRLRVKWKDDPAVQAALHKLDEMQ